MALGTFVFALTTAGVVSMPTTTTLVRGWWRCLMDSVDWISCVTLELFGPLGGTSIPSTVSLALSRVRLGLAKKIK